MLFTGKGGDCFAYEAERAYRKRRKAAEKSNSRIWAVPVQDAAAASRRGLQFLQDYLLL